jgi:tRNA pseudouridine13 synthase
MLRISKGNRATGSIKQFPEDFRVEEITQNGTVLQLDRQYSPSELGMEAKEGGGFVVFVLQKTNWNTAHALKEVARATHRGMKSVGFAGTKDRVSQSTQLCSMFGAEPEQLNGLRIKDIKINGAWKYDAKIELGMLAGNRFTIKVRNVKGADRLDQCVQLLGGTFPNYFGEQRFGTRANNFNVGLAMLKGDFEGAAMNFLTDTSNETNKEAIEARTRLAGDRDFTEALDYFPSYLKYERTVLDYLSKYERNFANALRRLPRSINLMFVHSVEDMIFNRQLERMIAEGHTRPIGGDLVCAPEASGFYDLSKIWKFEKGGKEGFMVGNILGYETEELTDFEKEELERLGLTPASFKAKGISELGCKGARRVLFAPYKDMSVQKSEGELTLGFSLPSGSYATVLVDQLIDRSPDPTVKDKYDSSDSITVMP